jgi:probable HAF family extracellular repeat protein
MTTYSFNYSVLDDPAAAGATVAFGINNLGQIVGYYLGGDVKNHGFLYSNGTYTSIDDPATSNFTVATGINDSGQFAPALVPAQQAGQSLRGAMDCPSVTRPMDRRARERRVPATQEAYAGARQSLGS